jgi:predicted ATPase
MITNIKASGFKSLHHFSLDIKAGLNVLVGPNGAGKSNIIEVFEFLSYLVESGVGDAFGKLGGVGRVLSKMPNDEYATSISISVEGEGIISRNAYYERYFRQYLRSKASLQRYRAVQYTYHVELEASRTSIVIVRESITARYGRVRRIRGRNEVNIEFEQSKRPHFSVARTGAKPTPAGITVRRNGDDAKRYNSERLAIGLKRNAVSLTTKSILDEAVTWHDDPILRLIRGDCSFDPPLNVVPDAVRALADVAELPGIRRDGGGFAATLWAYQNNTREYREQHAPYWQRRRRGGDDNFRDELIAHVQRVNSAITDIEAVWEAWESKIGVKCSLKFGKRELMMPVAGLSDGTLKWMALVAAILDRNSEFAIEEPENHVHPAVQKELVAILRERFDRDDHSSSFMLLSTHSETILNSVLPQELIVVAMDDGKTEARRPENIQLLNAEIQKTGFGLGHYYLAGALDA